MALGALATVTGVVVAGAAPVPPAPGAEHSPMQQTAGGLVVLAGWASLAWGIHRFGREGA
jgi:hypothetical protein